MRILIADDDERFREYAALALRERTGHQVSLVEDGVQALERTLVEQPDVLVLDWLMPRMNGTQVCRLVRARSDTPGIYIVFVTGRSRREELLECLNAGADDLLVKPIPPDVLVARIELAAQRLPREGDNKRLVRGLVLAAEQGNGELVVRGATVAGRVFFCDGKVVDVELDDGSGTLLQELALERGWDADTVSELSDECRRTDAQLTDVITTWGLLEPQALRGSCQAWLSRKLATLVALPDARSLFLPQRRTARGALAFELADVITLERAPTERPPASDIKRTMPSAIPEAGWHQAFVHASTLPPAIVQCLDRIIENEGVVGVAALERTSGMCVGMRGSELNPDAAWALIQCVNTMMRLSNVQDGVVTTDEHYHLVRLLPEHNETFLYAVVESKSVSLAMARLRLQAAVESHITA